MVVGALQRRPVALQLLRFVVVGVANTLTTYAVIWLLHARGGVAVGPASAAGYAVGMVQGFALNRFWTFASDDHRLPVAAQLAGFVAVNLLCGALFTRANVWLSGRLPLFVASVAATALVVPLSFVLNRLVFRAARAPAR